MYQALEIAGKVIRPTDAFNSNSLLQEARVRAQPALVQRAALLL